MSPAFCGLSSAGRPPLSHGSPAPAAWRPVKQTKQFAAATKPFSRVDEDVLKPGSACMTFDQTMGCDHVCVHHQLNLPRNSQDLSVRNAQARNRLMGLRARDRNLRRTANEPDCESMTTVIFACPKCGLAHEVTQVQVPTKKSGRFDCVDCGAIIHAWHGVFDYSGCRPYGPRPWQRSIDPAFTNPATFAGPPDPRRRGLSKPGRPAVSEACYVYPWWQASCDRWHKGTGKQSRGC